MRGLSESARRRVVVLLGLALVGLVGRLLATSLAAPPWVARGLYLFALGSLVATVFVVATE